MNRRGSEAFSRFREVAHRLRTYFAEAIWRPVPRKASLAERALRRVSRFFYLIVRGFLDDRVLVQAPALSLTTLLGLVPLLALAAALASGVGIQRDLLDQVQRLLTDYVAVGQQDVVQHVIGYVERTNLSALGGIGLVFLLYTSMSLLSSIEAAFNDIWGVDRRRPLYRRFTDYLSIVIIVPVLLIASTGLTAGLRSTTLVARAHEVALLSGATELGLKLAPLLVLGAGFAFLYKYMPYTTVQTKAALVAGLVTGVAWHVAQWAFIRFQIGVTQSNVIYGTFAALPIFLIWLNTSWIIVLVGCEIAYAAQHEATYSPPVPHGTVSIARRERAALQLVAAVWQRFVRGEAALPTGDLAAEIDLPRPVTVEIVRALLDAGVLAHATSPGDALLPARDLRQLSVGDLLLAYRHSGTMAAGEHGALHDARIDALHERLERAFRSEGAQLVDGILQTP